MQATTVHAAFKKTAARTPAADFYTPKLSLHKPMASNPGPLHEVWQRLKSNACGKLMHGPVTAMDTGSGCCLKTGQNFFHWFALNALGVSVVPINPDMRHSELVYLVSHSEIILAVCLAERVDELRAAASGTGQPLNTMLPHAVEPFPLPPTLPRMRSVPSTMILNALCCTPQAPPAAPRVACLAMLIFTSRSLVRTVGWRLPHTQRPGACHHPAAIAPCECHGLFNHGCAGCRRLSDSTGPFPSQNLVAKRHLSRASVAHYLGVMPAMLCLRL